MPRPKFDNRDRVRSRRIGFAADDSEYAIIESSAEAAGMPIGAYVRSVILGHEVTPLPAPLPVIDADSLSQLSGLGSNINQAMQAINQGKGNPALWGELESLLVNLRSLMQAIYTAHGMTWSEPSPVPSRRERVEAEEPVVDNSSHSTRTPSVTPKVRF